MSINRTTRRRYLATLGTALSAGFAGCAGLFDGQKQTTKNSPTPTPTTNSSDKKHKSTSEESVYTRVYQQTIDSVVLVKVTVADGRSGHGSGFVFRDNHIVTNAHVVSNATSVEIRFTNGDWRSVSVVGTDPSSDLAVVKVQNPPQSAKPLPLVTTQPPIGTEVVAIGNPYGFEGSVTAGIISGINRSIPAPNGYTIPDAIQTSTPVNPGNSGGPLVNLDGKVVGVINSGGGENIGFAISAALVNRVAPALIKDGEYKHAYLGVQLAAVTPSVAKEYGLEKPRGVVVTNVVQGSPAAGTLQEGDVIVSMGGTQIDTRQQLASYLALQTSPGDTIKITVIRNGSRQTVQLTLGARPERPGSGVGSTPTQP